MLLLVLTALSCAFLYSPIFVNGTGTCNNNNVVVGFIGHKNHRRCWVGIDYYSKTSTIIQRQPIYLPKTTSTQHTFLIIRHMEESSSSESTSTTNKDKRPKTKKTKTKAKRSTSVSTSSSKIESSTRRIGKGKTTLITDAGDMKKKVETPKIIPTSKTISTTQKSKATTTTTTATTIVANPTTTKKDDTPTPVDNKMTKTVKTIEPNRQAQMAVNDTTKVVVGVVQKEPTPEQDKILTQKSTLVGKKRSTTLSKKTSTSTVTGKKKSTTKITVKKETKKELAIRKREAKKVERFHRALLKQRIKYDLAATKLATTKTIVARSVKSRTKQENIQKTTKPSSSTLSDSSSTTTVSNKTMVVSTEVRTIKAAKDESVPKTTTAKKQTIIKGTTTKDTTQTSIPFDSYSKHPPITKGTIPTTTKGRRKTSETIASKEGEDTISPKQEVKSSKNKMLSLQSNDSLKNATVATANLVTKTVPEEVNDVMSTVTLPPSPPANEGSRNVSSTGTTLPSSQSINDLGEHAFQILLNIGAIQRTIDPTSPEYDSSKDDEIADGQI